MWRCARLRGADPVKAAALVGLNPLLVIYGVGGGHNDLLMLLAMVGGVYAILASRERVGGGLTMLADRRQADRGPASCPSRSPPAGRGRRPEAAAAASLLGAGVGLAALAALSFGVFGAGSVHMLGSRHQEPERGRLARASRA